MKKSIILSVFTFIFFSVSTSFAQTKWTDFVAQIPELSMPYEFDYEEYTIEAVKISEKDLKTHFKVKVSLADMWSAKIIGKITYSNGSVGIIWGKDDYPEESIIYLISYFNKKGKEEDSRGILTYAGYGARNTFTIKEESDNYVFEELYKDQWGKVVGKTLIFKTNSASW